MSMRELHRRAGWSEGRASGYRRGRDIRMTQVQQLAFALGVSVGSLASAIAIEMGPVAVVPIPGPAKRQKKVALSRAEKALESELAEQSPVRWRPGTFLKDKMRRRNRARGK